jgi:two-component system osmolarity sensor histidine kinase EnvZ
MILVLPVMLLQGVVAVSFIQRHYDGVTRQMAGAVAQELNFAIRLVEAAEDVDAAEARLHDIAAPLGMRLRLAQEDAAQPEALRRFYDLTGGAVEETFKAEVIRPLTLDLVSSDKVIDARILTDKGVLAAEVERRRMIASNPHQLLVVTGMTTLALVAVAVLFLRNQVRPIRDLAAAADAFGKGRTLSFRPAGAEEVRRAGAAFLAMRARIEKQIESRTRMLSSVSHDLRTPLTRMKLALAMMEDGDEAEELGRDIRDMERMIDEFLAFARGEAAEEMAPVDPDALVAELAEELRRGGVAVEIRRSGEAAARVAMRRGAVKRAVANLAENARAFGERVEIGLWVGRAAIEITVEDDGPGIPEVDRETALTPFARLDDARNQDRGGGVGLGLAIAADTARAHGGSLTLEDSDRLGGLRARMRLPR